MHDKWRVMSPRFRVKVFSREHAIAFGLLLNTFSSYYLGRLIIERISADGGFGNSISLVYPLCIVASAIIGAVFFSKTQMTRFLSFWTVFCVGASLLSASPFKASFAGALTSSVFLGASLGLGMPSVLNHFKETISVENRGKFGGIALFATLCFVPLIFPIMTAYTSSLDAIALAAWRACCLPMIFLIPKGKESDEPMSRSVPSLASVFRNRGFILYFTAWLMFALVDSFETGIVGVKLGGSAPQMGSYLKAIEPLFAAGATLTGGYVADRVGRKRVLIFGFVSLGVAYAVLGLLGETLFSWLVYFAVDGTALGLLWLLFLVVLWGDISSRRVDKFYAIGVAPFFLSEVLSVFLAPSMGSLNVESPFSLASFFLFLAVLPLLLAPETLPEKKIKERELKIYIDKAVKVKEKYS